MPIEQICGNQAPLEFSYYIHYVRALRFEDRPDYGGIRHMFKRLMRKEGFEYDHVFDWVMIANQAGNSQLNFSVESFDEIKASNLKKNQISSNIGVTSEAERSKKREDEDAQSVKSKTALNEEEEEAKSEGSKEEVEN
jgi:hypothetical protein